MPATRIVGMWLALGGGDAEQQARGRDDAVVGAEHGGAQPADAQRAVSFPVPRVAIRSALPRAPRALDASTTAPGDTAAGAPPHAVAAQICS